MALVSLLNKSMMLSVHLAAAPHLRRPSRMVQHRRCARGRRQLQALVRWYLQVLCVRPSPHAANVLLLILPEEGCGGAPEIVCVHRHAEYEHRVVADRLIGIVEGGRHDRERSSLIQSPQRAYGSSPNPGDGCSRLGDRPVFVKSESVAARIGIVHRPTMPTLQQCLSAR